ncbi:hypothetical protein [uncultured Tateyamaria sp.]|uniref:hypothetical protein n=1 Tax=uncultured Tateyamaria sp. TaxID=455651 RepID=UPI002639B199|nr:hypothetical protein [uncultured Tateyamaria sp.]
MAQYHMPVWDKVMSLRSHSCFNELADNVRALANGSALVEIVNSGNWGDGLIHAGQAEFLADIGVQVERIPVRRLQKKESWKTGLRRLIKGRNAIITGCGAFRDVYNRPSEFALAAKQFKHVLVMPSSLPFMPNLDARRTTFWRRDSAESMKGAPDARFCHDMAFYLQPSPRKATQDLGMFFRDDAERSGVTLPPGNVDLSTQGTHETDIGPFLDHIGACRVIHTNRLHIGIAGALLGREVHLYPGSNDKIKSMFEASLQPFYDNVHFHSEPPSSLYEKVETHEPS